MQHVNCGKLVAMVTTSCVISEFSLTVAKRFKNREIIEGSNFRKRVRKVINKAK
jgi:hypothetical protein